MGCAPRSGTALRLARRPRGPGGGGWTRGASRRGGGRGGRKRDAVERDAAEIRISHLRPRYASRIYEIRISYLRDARPRGPGGCRTGLLITAPLPTGPDGLNRRRVFADGGVNVPSVDGQSRSRHLENESRSRHVDPEGLQRIYLSIHLSIYLSILVNPTLTRRGSSGLRDWLSRRMRAVSSSFSTSSMCADAVMKLSSSTATDTCDGDLVNHRFVCCRSLYWSSFTFQVDSQNPSCRAT